MKLLALLLIGCAGCAGYAGQFDPPRPTQYEAQRPVSRPAPRRPDCEQERLGVRVWGRPGGLPVFPAGTVSTGSWSGKDFAAVTFWQTLRAAMVCDPAHEVGIWDEYSLTWRRPLKGDSLD